MNFSEIVNQIRCVRPHNNLYYITLKSGQTFSVKLSPEEFYDLDYALNPEKYVPNYELDEVKSQFDKFGITHLRIADNGGFFTKFEAKNEGRQLSTNGGITKVYATVNGKEYEAESICLETDQFCRKTGRNMAIHRLFEQIYE